MDGGGGVVPNFLCRSASEFSQTTRSPVKVILMYDILHLSYIFSIGKKTVC